DYDEGGAMGIRAGSVARYLGWGLLLVVLGAYLLSQWGGAGVPEKLILVLVMLLGPVAIVGMLILSELLGRHRKSLALQAATTLTIIGFAFFNLMIVVQLTTRAYIRGYIQEAPEESAREMLRWILRGVDSVQLGIDVSFDVFFSLGMILFAAVMYSHPRFGKWFSVPGVALGVLLLLFNLYTFPRPPADAELIDWGPFTALWWLAVIVQMIRSRTWAPSGGSTSS
ncbi:MAG: hypothetical protein ACRD5I_15660, partial [Candidatus Acidiferrales bacterium]